MQSLPSINFILFYIFGKRVLNRIWKYIYIFNKFIYFYFIYFWLHWVFVAAHGLSLVAVSEGYSSLRCAGLVAVASLVAEWLWLHCSGFSCCRAQALGMRAPVVVAHRLSSCGSRALERRLNSYGARA